MSKSRPAKHGNGKSHRGRYLLRLFMAGNGQNSKTALANLHKLCEEHLSDRFEIETVDVVKDFQAAVRDNILVTPALILVTPRPQVLILGNLSDVPTVLTALRISGSRP